MDYTVTEYREEDSKQVADLHAHLLSAGWRLSRSYLRWKYEENPFIRTPLLFLVRHGGNVVGLRGLFGSSWHVDPQGRTVVLPHADDLIVHPDHRNRGLFLPLQDATVAAARERGFPALVSLSGGKDTQNLCLLTGWKALGELEFIYRHPVHGQRSGRKLFQFPTIKRGRYRLDKIARGMGFSPGRAPSNQSVDRASRDLGSARRENIRISREADCAGMSSLAESAAGDRLGAERTVAFLRWRLRNPDRKYRFLYWHDSSLRGYMVLAWPSSDVNQVSIADYAVEDDDVFAELLDALGQSKHIEYKLMSSTLTKPHQQLVEAAGFLPDPSFTRNERRRFLYFPLAPGGDLGAHEQDSGPYPADWRVSLIDTMLS